MITGNITMTGVLVSWELKCSIIAERSLTVSTTRLRSRAVHTSAQQLSRSVSKVDSRSGRRHGHMLG
jgi:hypothetical protein